MLVLTRYKDEAIELTFGDTKVLVKISAIRNNNVRVAIDAPREVLITRVDASGKIETPTKGKSEKL